MRNVNGHSIYEFEDFLLDVDKLMLYRDEAEVALPPKVVKTLSVLVENSGEILSKDELMKRVWEDSIVEESNLSQYLYLLRKTVGNKPDGTPYIETLRRRGYRFNGDITVVHDAPPRGDHQPLDLPHLVGREKEIDGVLSLLRDDTRLVTLTGVGGVGKTSLARAVAARWSGSEVLFVELAALTRPEHVISAIGSALGLKESTSESRVNSVKAKLQKRSYLLVLDNFEQVASGAPDLEKLFGPDPSDLKLLVTSRVPLRIAGELLYSLKPLAIPMNASDDVDALRECESVALFRERARIVQPSFEINGENVGDVAEICRRLEGLPLAIELAAARTNLMSPEAMRNRLVQQLKILTGGSNEAPKRQQTMRDTIVWSYDLLSENDQAVFARLGVFSGGFDLEAAESVCADLVRNLGVSVLDCVSSLVEQNLLVIRTDLDGEPRIYMLEVVREFAKEVLLDKDESGSAARAHAEHFLTLAENAEPLLVAARSAAWLDRLEKEHDNLRAALAWAIHHDPAIGQRIAGAIWRFWWLHGHVREACEQLEQFLGIADTPPTIKAKMLTGATFLTRLSGDSNRSRQFAEEGVKLAEAANDLRNGALAYCQLGFLALDVEDFPEAGRLFRTGLELAETLDDIQILALLNNGLGELSRSKGEFEKATEFYGKALEFNRAAGDRVRQTTCLINLGATSLMLGEREQAARFYRQGLQISSEMEDMNGTLYCLEGLAGSFWASHDPERAAMIFGAAHWGRQENDLLLEPADQKPYEEAVTFVRAKIGSDLFDESFAKGSMMKLSEAVEKAIAGADDLPNAKVRPDVTVRAGRVAVERQGNVLRLVEWSEPAIEKDEADSIAHPTQWRPRKLSSRAIITASAAAVLLLSVVSATVWFGRSDRLKKDVAEQDIVQLTNGVEVLDATISPDGKYFVYHEPDGEMNRIWLQQTGHSSRQEIVPASTTIPLTKTFTPDGQFVYFLAVERLGERGSIYRVATLGGPVRKVVSDVSSGVSFSPDGLQMVFARWDGEEIKHVIKASDGSGEERVLFSSPSNFGNSAWSPDGTKIAIQMQQELDHIACAVATVTVTTGKVDRSWDEHWDACGRMEWEPNGRGVYMIGTRHGEGMTTRRDQLYFISYPEGRSRKITSEGNRNHVTSLGVTADGDVLVVPYNRSSQISVMDPGGDSRSALQISKGLSDGRAGIAPTADGRVAYIARSGESLNIWIMNQDGSDRQQLTDGSSAIEELRSGGDGRYLVFSEYSKDNSSHLFRIDINGSGRQQITSGEGREVDSSMSHDGKWIAFDSSILNGKKVDLSLWKQPLGGGERITLNRRDCQMPHFSPDDKYVSCVRVQKDILILSSTDGTLVRTLQVPQSVTVQNTLNFGARWTPDGRSLAYIVNDKGVSNIWVQPVDGSASRQLTNFTSGNIYHFAFSLDGSRLFLARGNQIRDAVLIRHTN